MFSNFKRKQSTVYRYLQITHPDSLLNMDTRVPHPYIQNFHFHFQLLYFPSIPGLSDMIFHHLHRLQSLIGCFCRPDLDAYLNFEENRVFRCRGQFSEEEFAIARTMTTTFGEFCQPLIDCILFELQTKSAKPRECLKTLVAVAEAFGLGFGTALPEIPTGKIFALPVLVLVSANRSEPPEDPLNSSFDSPIPEPSKAAWKRAVRARFPARPAPCFWALLAVLLHPEVEFRLDWSSMVYARRGGCHVLLTRRDEPAEIACTAWGEERPNVDLTTWFVESVRRLQRAWPRVKVRVESVK